MCPHDLGPNVSTIFFTKPLCMPRNFLLELLATGQRLLMVIRDAGTVWCVQIVGNEMWSGELSMSVSCMTCSICLQRINQRAMSGCRCVSNTRSHKSKWKLCTRQTVAVVPAKLQPGHQQTTISSVVVDFIFHRALFQIGVTCVFLKQFLGIAWNGVCSVSRHAKLPMRTSPQAQYHVETRRLAEMNWIRRCVCHNLSCTAMPSYGGMMFITVSYCFKVFSRSECIWWIFSAGAEHSNDSPMDRCATRHQEFAVVDASDCFFTYSGTKCVKLTAWQMLYVWYLTCLIFFDSIDWNTLNWQ